MKEPLVQVRGPIRELLDDFARMPEGRRMVVAGTLALLAHAMVFVVGGLLIFSLAGDGRSTELKVEKEKKKQLEVVLITPTPPPSERTPSATPTPTPEPKAVELNIQELALLVEMFRLLPEEVQRDYVDVDGLAQKKNLTKRALLESWADSVAGSRLPGKGDNPLPTQSGRSLPFSNFKDQNSNLGKVQPAEAADLEGRLPQLPKTPNEARPIFQPQPVAKSEVAQAKADRPIPKVAEVAKLQPKESTIAATPSPSRLLLAKATTPPPLKRVREAGADEIPMFINKPEEKSIPDLNLRPEGQPEPLKPQPTPESTPEPPKPKPTPAPTPTPEPKKSTPIPDQRSIIVSARLPNQTRPQPVQNPGYAPHQVKTNVSGGVSAPGENGVDAIATKAGKYKKSLNTTVGSRWTYFVNDPKFSSLVSAGQTTVHFVVDARGKIVRAKVTDNTSNSAHAQLCERAFLESQRDIDPPPPEVLRNGVYEDSFTFILY
jgi:hypothetical protein